MSGSDSGVAFSDLKVGSTASGADEVAYNQQPDGSVDGPEGAPHVAQETSPDYDASSPGEPDSESSSTTVVSMIGPLIALALFLFFMGPPLLRGLRRVLDGCAKRASTASTSGAAPMNDRDQNDEGGNPARERRMLFVQRHEQQLKEKREQEREEKLAAAKKRADIASKADALDTRDGTYTGTGNRAGKGVDQDQISSAAASNTGDDTFATSRASTMAGDSTEVTAASEEKTMSKLASRDPRAISERKRRAELALLKAKQAEEEAEAGGASMAQRRMERAIARARGDSTPLTKGIRKDSAVEDGAAHRTMSPSVAALVPTVAKGSIQEGSVRPDHYGDEAGNGGRDGAGRGKASTKRQGEKLAGASAPMSTIGAVDALGNPLESSQAREALLLDRDARFQAGLAADRSRTDGRKLRITRRMQRLVAARARLERNPEPEDGQTRPVPETINSAAEGGGEHGGTDGQSPHASGRTIEDTVMLLKVRAHGLGGRPRKRRFWSSDRLQLVMDWLEVDVGNTSLPPMKKQLFDDADPEVGNGLGGMLGCEIRRIVGGETLCGWKDFDVSRHVPSGDAAGAGDGSSDSELIQSQEGLDSGSSAVNFGRSRRTLAEAGLRRGETLRLVEVEEDGGITGGV